MDNERNRMHYAAEDERINARRPPAPPAGPFGPPGGPPTPKFGPPVPRFGPPTNPEENSMVKTAQPPTKKTTTIRATTGRLIVRVDEAEEKSPGGVVLPDQAKEKPTRGTVLSVGKGRVLDAPGFDRMDNVSQPVAVRADVEFKVNDVVIFGRYSGTEIQVDGETRMILDQTDVLAIIE